MGCIFIYENHAARRENGTSWWVCLCDVCFASKKSSEREFFIPAGTHLAVKLLRGAPSFKTQEALAHHCQEMGIDKSASDHAKMSVVLRPYIRSMICCWPQIKAVV